MELPKNHGFTNAQIVEMLLAKLDASNKISSDAGNSEIQRRYIETPWTLARASNELIWAKLDQVYIWTTSNDGKREQAYRRVADDVWEFSTRQKNVWKETLKWVNRHGNPVENFEWLQWQASLDTARY